MGSTTSQIGSTASHPHRPQRLSRNELRHLDEKQLIFELVRYRMLCLSECLPCLLVRQPRRTRRGQKPHVAIGRATSTTSNMRGCIILFFSTCHALWTSELLNIENHMSLALIEDKWIYSKAGSIQFFFLCVFLWYLSDGFVNYDDLFLIYAWLFYHRSYSLMYNDYLLFYSSASDRWKTSAMNWTCGHCVIKSCKMYRFYWKPTVDHCS